MKRIIDLGFRDRSRDMRETVRLKDKLATMSGTQVKRGILDDIDWTTASLSGLASYSFLLIIITF